jgi:hypothetical protein
MATPPRQAADWAGGCVHTSVSRWRPQFWGDHLRRQTHAHHAWRMGVRTRRGRRRHPARRRPPLATVRVWFDGPWATAAEHRWAIEGGPPSHVCTLQATCTAHELSHPPSTALSPTHHPPPSLPPTIHHLPSPVVDPAGAARTCAGGSDATHSRSWVVDLDLQTSERRRRLECLPPCLCWAGC